jgi:predicted dehydrogenase
VPSADLRQIAAWRERFNLGRPLSAQASTWVRYNEKPDGTWLDDPLQCPVAPIFRIGIYLINDLIEIFGEAREVQVMSERHFTKRPTPDHAQIAIRFRNGGIASVLASFCVNDGDNYRNRLALNFENGTVYRNRDLKNPQHPCELILVTKDGEQAREVERNYPSESSRGYPWQELHGAITSPSPLIFTDPDKVCAGLRVIDAIIRAETEGFARIDPE